MEKITGKVREFCQSEKVGTMLKLRLLYALTASPKPKM